jgi:serine/threonine protein phosphatase 1
MYRNRETQRKNSFATTIQACTAEGVRIYAIGDMHGMHELTIKMFDAIHAETAEWDGTVIIVGLGDYVDRGPRSDAVIDHLLHQSQSRTSTLVMLRGNHEDILLRFLDEPELFGPSWLQLGGAATLSSYGVRLPQDRKNFSIVRDQLVARLPLEHLIFLQSLPLSFEYGNLFFSHAGARPGVSLFNQTEKDLLWTRWSQEEVGIQFEKILIHGHTPTAEPVAKGGHINVDTGAYATGQLSAVRITPAGAGFLWVIQQDAS